MLKEKSTLVTASAKNIITFLDDIRIALGLSQQQMNTVILLLEKAKGAHLHFSIGNMDILFASNPSEDSDDKEVPLKCVPVKKITQTPSAIKFHRYTYTQLRRKLFYQIDIIDGRFSIALR